MSTEDPDLTYELDGLVRTQATENYQPDRTTQKEWTAVRDECISGGAMDSRCNIIAASLGTGTLDVIAKRLSCGCILIQSDEVAL